MYYCSKSEKCISELRQKLYDWKSNPDDHDKIIQELLKQNFIDEERYANYYVNDKFRFNKWGRIKIKMHLYQKRIPEDYIQQALNQISEDEYIKMLKNVINQKRKQVKEKDPYTLKNKLIRHASSKGFEADHILKVIDNSKI